MLERGLDALLAIRKVRRPALVLRQPHALVEHDLEVQPVIAELRDEHALDQVGEAVLLQQGRGDLAAGVGPALPAHHVVDPVVEHRDRVLKGGGGGPDAGRPGLLAGPNLVVEGDHGLFVEIFSFHGALHYRNKPGAALGIVLADGSNPKLHPRPGRPLRPPPHPARGLGSPAAMYLAAAGVGKIGIVDFGVVDASNLQRQLLHGHDDIGRPKVESAAETLRNLNPDVEVVPINEHLNSETAMRIFAPYDVIVDGTDNFPTRYLANDAAHFLAKPLVHGSIFRFEGRLALFDSAKGTGCYRCLFPEPPPPGSVQSCAEAGVFGVLPGIIGSMMAFETIKYLLDIGRPMVGRYLLFEGEDMTFRELKLRQNKACPLCGENPTVDSLIDYEAWCGTPAMEPSEARAS